MNRLERPHRKQPVERTPGAGLKMVEQGEPEHIRSCQYTITACPLGFRPERPEFGWAWPIFRPMPVDFSELQAALIEFEPRQPNVTVNEMDDLVNAIATGQTEYP